MQSSVTYALVFMQRLVRWFVVLFVGWFGSVIEWLNYVGLGWLLGWSVGFVGWVGWLVGQLVCWQFG